MESHVRTVLGIGGFGLKNGAGELGEGPFGRNLGISHLGQMWKTTKELFEEKMILGPFFC